jgi:hypothetical protein
MAEEIEDSAKIGRFAATAVVFFGANDMIIEVPCSN